MASLRFGLNEVVKVYSGGTASEEIFSGTEEIILDYSQEYLTYEILSGGTLVFEGVGNASATTKVISYSKDGGENWTSVDAVDATEISVSAGDKVMFKGTNDTYAENGVSYSHITGTSVYNVYGNIMSLIYGDDFVGQTTLTESQTFNSFFSNNANLKSVRNIVLPATTLSNNCYFNLFKGSTSITSAPKTLPATTATQSCYANMFAGCTSLLIAPTISANAVGGSSFSNMFSGCTSLVCTQNELTINAAAQSCFSGMFKGCTSLKAAPAISVTSSTAANSAFAGMFSGCTSLSFICINCNLTASTTYTNWVAGVGSKGVMYRTRTQQTSPTGWLVYNSYNTYASRYFTITALETGEINFNIPTGYDISVDLEININDTGWQRIPNGSFTTSVEYGATIKIRGRNAALATEDGRFAGFSGSTAGFDVRGNIMSLLYGDDFLRQTGYTSSYTFANLFKDSPVADVSSLILPAVNLTPYCYKGMFEGCTSLTTPPRIYVYYPAEGCCKEMFKNSGVSSKPYIYITDTAERCCEGMFSGCTQLTEAGVLGAQTLTPYCYANMFAGCSTLSSLRCNATNVGEEGTEYSLNNWLDGVASEGTFTKKTDVTYPSGASGIPDGWTIIDS